MPDKYRENLSSLSPMFRTWTDSFFTDDLSAYSPTYSPVFDECAEEELMKDLSVFKYEDFNPEMFKGYKIFIPKALMFISKVP